MFDWNAIVWNMAVARAPFERRLALLMSITVAVVSPAAHAANLGITNIVGGTLGGVTNTLGSTVGGVTNTLGGTLGGVTNTLGGTLGGVTNTLGGTLGGLTNTLGGTLGGLTNTLGGTLGGVTNTLGGTLGGLTNTLGGVSLSNGATAANSRVIQVLCGTAAAGSQILSSSETSNSIFLTQNTALVGAPINPKPDSQGGGAWVRGVGGEVQYNGSPALSSAGVSVPGGSVGCPSGFHQDFDGFQAGQDIAKLNFMGWNIHAGPTAGYVGGSGDSTGGYAPAFSTSTQIPFVGAYVAATNGAFIADALVRMNWYEDLLNSPGIGLNSQKLDAHGVSVSASLGYHWDVPNTSWFVEPGIGGVWSRTSIAPLNVVAAGSVVDGAILFNTIDSFIGRAGVRFGTTLQSGDVIYQPFVALSVWHEFDGNVQASLSNNEFATVGIPGIGTYGQYSFGASARVANTGWLGYARVDYRNGDHIEGWSGTGGIRYQFSPDPGISKVPVEAPVSDRAPNWTGFYIGAFAGADYGNTKMDFPGIGDAGPQVGGALTGGTLGYNYQIGSWVLGVEGDAGWTNARGSVACTSAFSTFGVLSGTDCADRADFLATATARLGYTFGRALYYAKVGGAWTHERFSVTCNNTIGVPCIGPATLLTQTSLAGDRTGWTVGYGVEFALTRNWSVMAEMNYIDFGNKNMTAADGTVLNAGMRISEGKIGVNYRF
jgi:opacity protein-like surface antigen